MLHPRLRVRAAGVLLHPTSLPGPWIGDLGSGAIAALRWMTAAGLRIWQVLPLGPVGDDGSPYNSPSAFAGNELLLSPEELMSEGLLPDPAAGPRTDPVDYPAARAAKTAWLMEAWARFSAGMAPHLDAPFAAYRQREAAWLEDYTLFQVLRRAHGGRPWTAWDPALRQRRPAALDRVRRSEVDALGREAFGQFLFDRQWAALRRRAHEAGLWILGDLPFYVAHDSADVWAWPELFALDERGQPLEVAGVPPDDFSATGQRWGHPLYRWDEVARRGFEWWIARSRRLFDRVDAVRLDHFRGFVAAWAIPAAALDARTGRWVPGPGEALFRALARALGPRAWIAEDLGCITPDVEALRRRLGLPSMRVLQFAFDGDPANPHRPEHHPLEAVAYTGTHDNDTLAGWWAHLDPATRARVAASIELDDDPLEALRRAAWGSAAAWALMPMQDALGLGSEARLNTPGRPDGNWRWRLPDATLPSDAAQRLRALGRATRRHPPRRLDPGS